MKTFNTELENLRNNQLDSTFRDRFDTAGSFDTASMPMLAAVVGDALAAVLVVEVAVVGIVAGTEMPASDYEDAQDVADHCLACNQGWLPHTQKPRDPGLDWTAH